LAEGGRGETLLGSAGVDDIVFVFVFVVEEGGERRVS